MFSNDSFAWEVSIVGLSLTAFTLVHILTKPIKHKTDVLLSVWLVIFCIPLIHTVLAQFKVPFGAFHALTNPTMNLLHGPILYFYVRMLVSDGPLKLRRAEWLHFLPFVLLYLAFLLMPEHQPMQPSTEKPGFGDNLENPGILLSLFIPLLKYFGFINGLSFIFYSLLTVYSLMIHQRNIRQVFSQTNNRITLNWLYALPVLFCLLVILNFINENLPESGSIIHPPLLHLISFLCFIVLLCFFGVKQKPVFHKHKPLALSKPTEAAPLIKQAVSNTQAPEQNEKSCCDIDADTINTLTRKLQQHMERDKPYLDPDFTVYTLAESLSVPRRTLSQVLNTGLSKNFYQYVNEFRIDEVKQTLQQADNTDTILDIAFACGFKSKSSFNSLFKQHCGVTPSQYRKNIRKPLAT